MVVLGKQSLFRVQHKYPCLVFPSFLPDLFSNCLIAYTDALLGGCASLCPLGAQAAEAVVPVCTASTVLTILICDGTSACYRHVCFRVNGGCSSLCPLGAQAAEAVVPVCTASAVLTILICDATSACYRHVC